MMGEMSMMIETPPEVQIIVCPPDVVQVPPVWMQEILDFLAMFGISGFF